MNRRSNSIFQKILLNCLFLHATIELNYPHLLVGVCPSHSLKIRVFSPVFDKKYDYFVRGVLNKDETQRIYNATIFFVRWERIEASPVLRE